MVTDGLEVLKEYDLNSRRVEAASIATGFSGAGVWRVQVDDANYVLKRWPSGQPAYVKLADIHAHLQVARHSGLAFVPEVMTNRHGDTVSTVGGAEWELAHWLPGTPVDFPEPEQLHSAIHALALLHSAWRASSRPRDICHGVHLRYQRLGQWTESELQCIQAVAHPLLRRAGQCWLAHREQAARKLVPWLARKLPQRLCIGDVWAEHVLFTRNEVTGIVDYGGMRFDSPAQDLARLLGSYRLSNKAVAEGIASSYPGVSDEVCTLTMVLIDSGRWAALANWLRWLVIEKRLFTNQAAVLHRLERLVEQAEAHG